MEVQRRWRRRLRDGRTRVYVLERQDEPVGYVAFGDGVIHHLGVLADQHRRGYGSVLLEFASMEVFAEGAAEASLWVLSGNEARSGLLPRARLDRDRGAADRGVPALSRGAEDGPTQPSAPRRSR